MPGDIGAAAAAAPLCLNTRQNLFKLGKTPGKTPGIAVIFQNWKKIQKPKLQSNATVLLRWQHAARHSPPSTQVEETSSTQGRIAPPLLRWGRAAMRSHSLSRQRTLQHARWDRPCIAAQARRSSSIWGEEKPSSVQRALPLYCCTGNVLQGTPPPEKHTLQSAPTLTPTSTPTPMPTPTPRLKVEP
jgi:hypothetical protein